MRLWNQTHGMRTPSLILRPYQPREGHRDSWSMARRWEEDASYAPHTFCIRIDDRSMFGISERSTDCPSWVKSPKNDFSTNAQHTLYGALFFRCHQNLFKVAIIIPSHAIHFLYKGSWCIATPKAYSLNINPFFLARQSAHFKTSFQDCWKWKKNEL